MDFYDVVKESEIEGQTHNPFAGRKDGEWIDGYVSIDFLNTHFGQYDLTAEQMIKKTKSEGLKKYFQWLKDEGKID